MPSTNFGSDINSVGLLQRLGEVAKSVDGHRYAKKPRTFSISGDGGGRGPRVHSRPTISILNGFRSDVYFRRYRWRLTFGRTCVLVFNSRNPFRKSPNFNFPYRETVQGPWKIRKKSSKGYSLAERLYSNI